MKKYLKIILIGAASWTKDNEKRGGQISNIKNLINENISVISCDPDHQFDDDKYLESKACVPISRANSPNILNLKCLNVYEKYASELFSEMLVCDDTYYLVLVFTGIEMEEPSFSVAKKLRVKNKYFWDTNNALFLSMGCLCYPPNLKELINNLGIYPENTKKLNKLFSLQNAYYALQNNVDALSRAYSTNLIPEWAHRSLNKLKHIKIYGIKDAYEYYLRIDDLKNIGLGKLIRDELQSNNLLQFWNQRPNDFIS